MLGGVIIGDNVIVDADGKISTAMSAADKTKLDGIESGAQVNILGQADKTKLDGISAGAQVNVIEHISVNGNELSVSDKSVGFYEHLMRKNSTAYAVGDIAYSASLPSWARLECVTAGTTAATEPALASLTVNTQVTDGTVTWMVRTANIFEAGTSLILESMLLNIIPPGCYERDIPFYASDKLAIATPNRLWVNIVKNIS